MRDWWSRTARVAALPCLAAAAYAGTALAQNAPTNRPATVPPSFERPLVIDMKLERDVKALQDEVKALREALQTLQKQVDKLKAESAGAKRQ